MNKYWNSNEGKTYRQLEAYYKAPKFLDEQGYYSSFYETTYYDGYGYNFYTGTKGYYEYSRGTSLNIGAQYDYSQFLKTLSSMCGIIGFFAFAYYYYNKVSQ